MKNEWLNLTQNVKIITLECFERTILNNKTEDIQKNELSHACEIGEKLYVALQPYFPAAGLAAPQIGIGKSVFIYSYDRDPKNLEVVINPSYIPIGDGIAKGWEGCLSVITTTCKMAYVPRYEKIQVAYLNIKGEKVEKNLEGFAAKVFQHEYHHLQGIVNIDRNDAVVKEFPTKGEMNTFLQAVKKEDAARYQKPAA